MASLSEFDDLSTFLERNGWAKKIVPKEYKPEDLVYSNLINVVAAHPTPETIDTVSLEETITIKSAEIIDLFRSLRKKSDVLRNEIKAYESRIDSLNENLESVIKMTRDLSTSVEDLELIETTNTYQAKLREYVTKQIETIQKKLTHIEHESEQVNTALGKINTLVFTGVAESLKPEERERIASGKQCPICITKPVNRVFNCGHVVCDTCVSKLGKTCHMCRRNIKNIFPLYIDTVTTTAEREEINGYEPPHPQVQVSPWIISDDDNLSPGQLVGVNTIGVRRIL